MQEKEYHSYPEALLKAINDGLAGNCTSVVINFQNKQIRTLEIVRDHKDVSSFSTLLKEAPFQDLQIKQHGAKVTYIQQKVKILVNHIPAKNRISLDREATPDNGSQSSTADEF